MKTLEERAKTSSIQGGLMKKKEQLKRAFNTVDHSILPKNMGKYGTKGFEMIWFQ